MTSNGRPALCLIVPGHDLIEGSGLARYLCSLAGALSEQLRVTLVFRRVLAPVPFSRVTVAALDAGAPGGEPGHWDFASAPRALGRFAHDHLAEFDVVLEATWLQTGKISGWCAQRGIPAIPLVDRLPIGPWLEPLTSPANWLAHRASGRNLRRAPVVVAGSERIKEEIAARWRVPSERIEVVHRGVDRVTFAPRDQAAARARLAIPADQRMLLYAGPLGEAHDLTPLLEAAARAGDPSLRIHVIGDGEARVRLERGGSGGAPVVYHRRVRYEALADYVAAADLCIAVEDPHVTAEALDWGGSVAAAECLSAGRPVAVGTRERMDGVVRHRVSGFYVEHDVLSWIRFLQRDCPPRNTLRIMGKAATATPLPTLQETAAHYVALCERVRHQG